MELVIRVKYEGTLRRFTVPFDGNGYLNLDFSGLKAKIFNFFKLTPDDHLTITYVDEDSDWVTIVNEEDLHDAVRQCLNPLRITVSLDSYKSGNVDGSGSSTPWFPHSAFAQSHSFPNYIPHFPCQRPTPVALTRQPLFTSGAPLFDHLASKASPSSEVVSSREQLMSKLVQRLASIVASNAPEKYNDFLLELSHEMMTRAPSPDPLTGELIDTLSNLAKRVNSPTYEDHERIPKTSSNNLAISEQRKTSSGLKGSRDPLATSEDTNGASHASNVGNMTRSVSPWDTPCVSSDSKTSRIFHGSDFISLPGSNKNGGQKVKDGYHSQDSCRSSTAPLKGEGTPAGSVAPQNIGSGQIGHGATSNMPTGRFYPTPVRNGSKNSVNMGMIFHPGIVCDGCGVNPIPGPRYKSKAKKDYDLCSFCMAAEGKEADYTRMDLPMHFNHLPGLSAAHTHLGIECDACGVLPITGLRYKSKVKENYDLCSICFAKLGKEADYTEMSWTTRKCPYSPQLREEETNRSLLVSNRAPIKRIVVDLVDTDSDSDPETQV